MKYQIKHFAAKIKTRLAARRAKLEYQDKNRRLFQAGLIAFNNGPTYFGANRDQKRSLSKVNVDRTSLYY